MTSKNIRQWSLFREKDCEVNLREYSGIHFFNNGQYAYLIKNGKLYLLGETVQGTSTTSGQFRYLSTTYIPEPCLLEANGIKGISTGAEHTVVLDNDGNVYCLGSNTCGQLGAGHCGSIEQPYKTNLKDIDKISCGRTFTIALSKCDELWFWGRLNLVDSSDAFIVHLTPTLIELPGDPVPKFISAGDEHIAVVNSDDKVFIWGNNTVGQLGLGHRNIVRHPELLYIDPSIIHSTGFAIVLCGDHSTVFLTEQGMVGICNENTNNVVQIVCDNSFRIITLATHWRTKFFTAADVCGFYYVLDNDNDGTNLIRVAYEDIADGFIDIGTPSVQYQTQRVSSGIQSITHTEATVPDQCAGYVEVADLYNSENYSDIQIKLSDCVIYAHKLILTKQSANLKKTITENGAEIKIMDMSNMNSTAYRTYIKFLYTGIVDLQTIDNIPEVFSLAEQDNNEKLKSLCLEIWNNDLKQENIVSAFNKVSILNLQLLINACGGVLCQHLQYILNTEEYNALPVLTKLSLLTLVALHKKKLTSSSH